MAYHVRRTRGCAPPLSHEAVAAAAAQVAFTALTVAALARYPLDSGGRGAAAAALAVYIVPAAVLMAAWAYCVVVDPALPGGIAVPCMRATQDKTRYCRLCGKVVPGLDHHCMWLNTCVSKRTYWAFFLLATCGVVQHTAGAILGVLVAALWSAGDGGAVAYGVVVAALGCVGVSAFGSVWVFHLYLLHVGMGTYDWLLHRDAARAAMPARPVPVPAPTPAPAAALPTLTSSGVALELPGGPAAAHAEVTAGERAVLQERWEYVVDFAAASAAPDDDGGLASPLPPVLPVEFLPHLAATAAGAVGSASRVRADFELYRRFRSGALALPAAAPLPHTAGFVPPPPPAAAPLPLTTAAPPPDAAAALRDAAIASIHEAAGVQPLVAAAAGVALHSVADPLANVSDALSPTSAAAATAGALVPPSSGATAAAAAAAVGSSGAAKTTTDGSTGAAAAYDTAYFESKQADVGVSP